MSSRKFATEAFVFALTCVLVGALVIFILVADDRRWFNSLEQARREAATWFILAGWWFSSKFLLVRVRRALERRDREDELAAGSMSPAQKPGV